MLLWLLFHRSVLTPPTSMVNCLYRETHLSKNNASVLKAPEDPVINISKDSVKDIKEMNDLVCNRRVNL